MVARMGCMRSRSLATPGALAKPHQRPEVTGLTPGEGPVSTGAMEQRFRKSFCRTVERASPGCRLTKALGGRPSCAASSLKPLIVCWSISASLIWLPPLVTLPQAPRSQPHSSLACISARPVQMCCAQAYEIFRPHAEHRSLKNTCALSAARHV